MASVAITSACGEDASDGGAPARTPTPSPTAAAAPRTAPSGDGATQTPGDAEVTGIIGAVSTETSTIEITRVSGADVRRIEVTPATAIRGGRLGERRDLGDLRPSDRIVATGEVQGDTLVAREITVQSVVPGAHPGG
jgi:hypothetical protein